MHHVVLERWSRGRSAIHARDPRAKVIALLCFLVIVATTPMHTPAPAAGYALFVIAAVLIARLPLLSVFVRAAVVLPFSATFAAMVALAGDLPRAAALLEKSYLSALAVLIVAGATPVQDLLRAIESLGAPRFLVMIVQFLYRYLFVISEQAQHMRMAASCRGFSGSVLGWRRRLRAAAGAISVLFARSYARAEGIHSSMLARGYQGRLHVLAAHRFGWKDVVFLLLAVLIPLALRSAAGALG